ncbi:hypothetical protein JVT61DRAFT_1628 [Boletus reticuloceps]|uniref:Uncharacterized protein n=1 Tax=Boletus reticuloceps TaxID=495285 RepID=A0A8I2YTX9_9AGAM|nr:hypothetical protein JVT61DRAFT_1628 [Boletus reticuloceps]
MLVNPNAVTNVPSQPSLVSEYPPIYLTSNNIPVTDLEPPAYNYEAVDHPSTPNNQFLNFLLQANTHHMTYTHMDASSKLWAHACDNIIGKDGPSDQLIDQAF